MKVVEWDRKENISKILIDILEIDPKFSFDRENEEIFFLYNNGVLCGYAVIVLNDIAELKKIFILPKLRNNGYGTFPFVDNIDDAIKLINSAIKKY